MATLILRVGQTLILGDTRVTVTEIRHGMVRVDVTGDHEPEIERTESMRVEAAGSDPLAK